MNFEDEFSTVDLIIESEAETRGVDAFCLSLIKAERQMRKLFTFLIFQNFKQKDISELKKTLESNSRIYFKQLHKGFNCISSKSLEELIGQDYDSLQKIIITATNHRNKIFHGQLTGNSLNRIELLNIIKGIKGWCKILADNAEKELGYDGFGRDSYRHSTILDRKDNFGNSICSIEEYEKFLM